MRFQWLRHLHHDHLPRSLSPPHSEACSFRRDRLNRRPAALGVQPVARPQRVRTSTTDPSTARHRPYSPHPWNSCLLIATGFTTVRDAAGAISPHRRGDPERRGQTAFSPFPPNRQGPARLAEEASPAGAAKENAGLERLLTAQLRPCHQHALLHRLAAVLHC